MATSAPRFLFAGLAVAVAAVAACPAAAGDGSFTTVGNPALRFGVVGDRAKAMADRIEPFRHRLEITLDADVEVVPFASGRSLIDAFAAGKIDYAVLSGTAYATTWQLCACVEPIAVPRAADGTAGVHALVVARAAGSIERVDQLKGRTLAVAGETSVAGRLLPLAELAAAGVATGDLARLIPTSGPDTALGLLVDGKADAAVVWASGEGGDDLTDRGTLAEAIRKGRVALADLRVVWTSSLIAHPPHVVRSALPEAVKTRIRGMLEDLQDRDPDAYDAVAGAYGGGFVPVGQAAYRNLLPLVTPAAKPRG